MEGGGGLVLGLIHFDRVACQMQFSAKLRRLEFTYTYKLGGRAPPEAAIISGLV